MNSFPTLHRALLLGTTAIGLLAASGAAARVGVTSATDGDPVGKPPTENERVLRIGIDVQANELITTRANDRAHLMFLDGTSLTVGPNAQLTIDRFVYDPDKKTGDLAVTATKGVLRLVGGKISKANPVTINTPSATIGIRGGITILDVQPTSTKSTFVFGNNMTVSAGGQTQNVTRAGSTVTTNAGAGPSTPVLAKPAELGNQMGQLEGTSSSGSGTGGGQTGSQPSGQGGGQAGGNTAATGNADAKASSSGLSGANSSRAPNSLQQPSNQAPPVSSAQRLNNSNVVTTALSNNQTEQQQKQAETQQTASPQAAPVTRVIVTQGRFRIEPAYTNFNNLTLGVTPVAGNNGYLATTGTVTGSNATIGLADGRSFTVPWQPGGGAINFSINHPTLGLLTGRGVVSATGDFFAYSFTDSTNKNLGFVGGTPTTMAQFPTSGIATHTMVNSSLGGGNALAFAPQAVGADAAYRSAATQSPMYSVHVPHAGMDVGSTVQSGISANSMQSTISISGTGAAQKSYMGLFIGEYFKDYNNNTMFNSGGYMGTYRASATDRIARTTASAATFDTPSGNSIFGPNADVMAFGTSTVSSSYTFNGMTGVITSGTTTRVAQAAFDQPYTGIAGTDYYSSNYATKTSTPSGVGSSRTTREMNGYVGGIVEQRDASASNVPGNFTTRTIGGSGALPTDIVIKTDATSNRVEAVLTVSQFDGATTSATFQIGGINVGRIGRSSFVDDNIYAARDRAVVTGGPSTTSVTVSGNTSTGVDVTSRTYLASYNAAPIANFFADHGVTPCTCDFMTWGWWSGEVRYESTSVYNPGGRDRLNLATYVAGTLSTAADLNTLNTMGATATYTGHLVGNVQNGSSSYVAAGSYTNAWSFGPRTGNVNVTFDGASFSGVTSQPNAAINSFSTSAPLASTGVTGRNLGLTGSFVNAPGVTAKGQMGNFTITGTGYQAGGTFAAQKP